MSAPDASAAVVVIGAGIVGLSVALRLQLDGYQVSVVDEAEPMSGCSSGNAGCLSEANLFPPATAETLLVLPKLLLSRSGPLVIRPSYLGTMAPWMWRAAGTLARDRYLQVIDAMAALTSRAIASFDALTRASGASELVSRNGLLVAFRTEAALQTRARRMPWWERADIAVERLDGPQMKAIVPALRGDLSGGLLFTRSGRCSNPRQLGLRYADRLREGGATFARARVLGVSRHQGARIGVHLTSGVLTADKIVVCAGHHSGRLIEGMGGPGVPMACERGYHLMLPAGLPSLRLPVIFGEPYFAATPMDEGLRLAGTAEFAQADAPANFGRAWLLLKHAREYLTDIDATGATPWIGTRPSLPDGMPAIGRLLDDDRVVYAFGHGHNGLTLSAVTAECVSALVTGALPPAALKPFALERFH